MVESTRGLLDTSVLIAWDSVTTRDLPEETAITSVTLAELAAGPHAARDDVERAGRQDRLQWAATTWDPLPFDSDAARAYGRVYAASRAAGRTSRSRLADLLIAAVALSRGLPLYTRNPADFDALRDLVQVVSLPPAPRS